MTHFGLIDWNAVALEAVKELRPVPVSDKPTLAGGYGPQKEEKDKKKSPKAVREDTRRNGIKELYAELSRYYEPPEGTKKWGRPKLRSQSKPGYDHSTL